jgi:hypothetical protein
VVKGKGQIHTDAFPTAGMNDCKREPETNQAVSNSNHFQAKVKPHKKNLAFPQHISYTAIPDINLHMFH